MTKLRIISNFISESCGCDCDSEFARMMSTRYLSKKKSFLLENKSFIINEVLEFYDYYNKHVLNSRRLFK